MRISWKDLPDRHVLSEEPKGIVHYALQCSLLSSKNEYLPYPCQGIMRITERGVNFEVISAQFMRLNDDGLSMGAFVEVGFPVFTIGEGMVK